MDMLTKSRLPLYKRYAVQLSRSETVCRSTHEFQCPKISLPPGGLFHAFPHGTLVHFKTAITDEAWNNWGGCSAIAQRLEHVSLHVSAADLRAAHAYDHRI